MIRWSTRGSVLNYNCWACLLMILTSTLTPHRLDAKPHHPYYKRYTSAPTCSPLTHVVILPVLVLADFRSPQPHPYAFALLRGVVSAGGRRPNRGRRVVTMLRERFPSTRIGLEYTSPEHHSPVDECNTIANPDVLQNCGGSVRSEAFVQTTCVSFR